MRPDALVLSGGGARIFAMLGALCKLQKEGELTDVRTLAGTSAGGLLATALATGRDLTVVYRSLLYLKYEAALDFAALSRDFGLDAGRSLDEAISFVADPDDTFRKIRERRGVKLVVCATNLSRRRPEYFGPDTHPDMRVATALRASCAVPVFFTAVRIDGDVFVDGGVADNFPTVAVASSRRALGVRFAPGSQPVTSLDSFLGALVESCATAPAVPAGLRARDWLLELDAGDVSTVDFRVPIQRRHDMFRLGHAQAARFVKKRA